MALKDIEKLKEKVDKDPKSKLFVPLAEEYRKEGMLDEAVKVLLAGLESQPSYSSARVSLGKIYVEKGMLREAREELEIVIKAIPDNLYAQKKLAEIYRDLGDTDKAIKAFKTLIRLNPMDEEAANQVREIERGMQKEPPVLKAPQSKTVPSKPVPESLSEDDFDVSILDEEEIGTPEQKSGTPLSEEDLAEFKQSMSAGIHERTEGNGAEEELSLEDMEEQLRSESNLTSGNKGLTEELDFDVEAGVGEDFSLDNAEEPISVEEQELDIDAEIPDDFVIDKAEESAAEEGQELDIDAEIPEELVLDKAEEPAFAEEQELDIDAEIPENLVLDKTEEPVTDEVYELDMGTGEDLSLTPENDGPFEEPHIDMDSGAGVDREVDFAIEEEIEPEPVSVPEQQQKSGIAFEDKRPGRISEITPGISPAPVNNVKKLLEIANELVAGGSFAGAVRLYNQILASDPGNKEVMQRAEDLKMLIKLMGKEKEVRIDMLNTFHEGIKKRKDEFYRNT